MPETPPRNPARPGPVAVGWTVFTEHVLPVHAGDVQRQEMRRAFYAGCLWLFETLTQQVSEGEEATDADLAMMDTIKRELDQFMRDLRSGRA